MKSKFLDYFDFEKANTLLEGFNKATGFVTAIIDLEGNILSQSGWRQICTDFHRKNPGTLLNCINSDTVLATKLREGEKYHSYKCMNGLIDIGLPIVIRGEHIANIFIGQFFFEEPDIAFFKKQAKEYGFEESAYLEALSKVPIVSKEKVDDAVNFLLNILQTIIELTVEKIEQLELNEALIKSEDKYKLITENTSDVISVYNFSKKRVTYVSPSVLNLMGYSPEEVMSVDYCGAILPETIEHTKATMLKNMKDFLNNPKTSNQYINELRQKCKNGDIIWVEVSTNYRFNAEGELETINISRNIDKRKKLEAQLRNHQKLESIGTLASGVAHEINNPINGIMNYGQIIIDSEKNNEDTKAYAKEIIHETQRVAAIVKNLQDFSRQTNVHHSLAKVGDIIERTLSLIRTIIKKDQIILEVNIEEDLPQIECRCQQMQQVLINLMTNARDSLNEKYQGFDDNKKLILSASKVFVNNKELVRFIVEDHGKGISEEVQDRVFEPFFSTKPKNKGTGLGLSISYGLVKDHNGDIRIETKEGEYTKFIVELPISK